jgi:hypothetical protein
MATYQTYQSVGNKEDLTEILTNISPMDTWFTSTIGTAPVKGTYHEWQNDVLASAGENAAIEGAAFTDGTITPTTRSGNYTQILTKCFKIAKTEEAVDKAGRASEIAYQTEKNLKEMSKDLEYALLLNSAANSGASGTARLMQGAYGFLLASGVVETGTGTGTEALTETMLNDVLQDVWAEGGKPQQVVCGAFQKRKISGFTTNTRYMVADENKLSNAVDVYQSDFGTVTVRLHHQVNTTYPDVLFVFGDMDHWKKCFLRGVKREKQPFAGDAELFSIIGEATLEARAPKGHGLITGLTTS